MRCPPRTGVLSLELKYESAPRRRQPSGAGPKEYAMAMSTVAPRREKTTRFRRAPRDRSSRILFDLAGAERRMGGVSSALWRALYVRDPEGHLRANPAWESANATTRRRAIESLVRLRNSAQFVFRRANGAINLL